MKKLLLSLLLGAVSGPLCGMDSEALKALREAQEGRLRARGLPVEERVPAAAAPAPAVAPAAGREGAASPAAAAVPATRGGMVTRRRARTEGGAPVELPQPKPRKRKRSVAAGLPIAEEDAAFTERLDAEEADAQAARLLQEEEDAALARQLAGEAMPNNAVRPPDPAIMARLAGGEDDDETFMALLDRELPYMIGRGDPIEEAEEDFGQRLQRAAAAGNVREIREVVHEANEANALNQNMVFDAMATAIGADHLEVVQLLFDSNIIPGWATIRQQFIAQWQAMATEQDNAEIAAYFAQFEPRRERWFRR